MSDTLHVSDYRVLFSKRYDKYLLKVKQYMYTAPNSRDILQVNLYV